MAQEFSKGSDNYINQSPTTKNLTSSILFDEVSSDWKAVSPPSQRQSNHVTPVYDSVHDTSAGSPVANDTSAGSPVSSHSTGRVAEGEVVTAGNLSGTVPNELNFKDDSLYCGKSSSYDVAWYLNWNMVPEAVQTIGFCQSMASSSDSFSRFMEDVVQQDSFWGAEIELQYSTDKKLGMQVSGFTITQ